MKSISQKLILASFVLAVMAAIVSYVYLRSLNAPKEVLKKTSILVATESIPARTLIDKKMVKEVDVTESSILGDYIKDSSEVIGKYTKETILKNEGFYKEKLLNNDSDELSLKIDSDHRAISINASGDSGVAALIKPGDFVDIIVYLAEKKDGEKIVRPDLSKMLLQNIQVVGIDKQINREDKSDNKSKDSEKTLASFLVTLSVLTTDVEKLVLSESIGKLKLALRPLKNDTTNETKGATFEELIKYKEADKAEIPSQTNNDSSSGNDEKYISYTVKQGDTLQTISKVFYGDPKKYLIIQEANQIYNKNLIAIGTVIKIPVVK